MDDNQQPAIPPEPEKELLTWTASSRPFKRRDRRFWITVVSMAAIFGLIAFLAEGVMPVVVLISIIFLYYVLSTVEPENIVFALTNYGVKILNKTTPWVELTRFWFSRRHSDELLIFETARFPGRLEIVIKPNDKDKLKNILKKFLHEEEAPPSTLDKAANYFSQKLPGNQPSK